MAFVAAIVGAVTSSVGTGTAGIIRARAIEREAKRHARTLIYRANDSDLRAFQARREGAVAAGVRASAIKPLQGAQKAAQAANGVDISSGTAKALRVQAARFVLLDAMTVRMNAERHATNLDRASGRLREEARLTLKYGKQAARATRISSSIAANLNLGTGLAEAFAVNAGQAPPDTSGLTDTHASASAFRGDGPWDSGYSYPAYRGATHGVSPQEEFTRQYRSLDRLLNGP